MGIMGRFPSAVSSRSIISGGMRHAMGRDTSVLPDTIQVESIILDLSDMAHRVAEADTAKA
jgi:hypothetical protein